MDDEEGWASVAGGKVNGRRSDWEDPTTGTCRQQPEKAQKRRTGRTRQVCTGGRNLQKEAALRYWLRMAEMLRGKALTVNGLLSQKEGDVEGW